MLMVGCFKYVAFIYSLHMMTSSWDVEETVGRLDQEWHIGLYRANAVAASQNSQVFNPVDYNMCSFLHHRLCCRKIKNADE